MKLIKNPVINRVFRIASWIVGAWLILGTIIFIIYPAWRADNAFIDLEYRSKIYDIEYRTGHRGHPHLKLNSGWYLLTIDEMQIAPYIHKGDSIIKEKGSRTIKIFSNDENGNLISKEFD